jgi:hypothetical protein
LTSLSKLPFKQWLSNRTSRKQLWVVCTASVAVLIAAYSFYGVRVEASVDRNGLAVRCGLNAPIMVVVHNYTFHRLAGARLTLEGWRDGRSKDILTHSWFYFDTVTGPFRTSSQCLSDDAFAIRREEAVTPAHEETEEERHARIQKMADNINEQDRLASIVADPKATEYDKLDALDKALSLNNPIHVAKVSPNKKEENVRFSSSQMLAEINELKRVTSGVTIVVREVEPEFY